MLQEGWFCGREVHLLHRVHLLPAAPLSCIMTLEMG